MLGNDKPTIKLLMNYEGKVAPHWHDLGIQLLQEEYVHQLDIIQQNYPTNIERCCTEMFKFWLNVDTNASWDKLINVLERIGQISLAEKIRNGKIFSKSDHVSRVDTWYNTNVMPDKLLISRELTAILN